jgi:hypothetical protein
MQEAEEALISHLNIWHESALAKGEAGLPHGMSPAVASAYEAYHKHIHLHPNVRGHLDHWHKQDGTLVKSFLVSQSCGCEVFCYGQPGLGEYISCSDLRHQGTYKILSVREQA